MTLISLAEHERRRREPPKRRGNGITCPKCGHELYDSQPFVTLTSMPPQCSVECLACGWHGNRTV